MVKSKDSTGTDGLHRSGFHPSDENFLFEKDGPSEGDMMEALRIWDAIHTLCKDTYGESYYDPPIVTTKDGVTRSKDYRRGWFRGEPDDSERELAARILAGECRASGIYSDTERRWIRPIMFRMLIPFGDTSAAIASNGQRIEEVRIHLRTGEPATPEILEENERRVKHGEAAGNIQTEAKQLEKWARQQDTLRTRLIPDWNTIRVSLHRQQAVGATVFCPKNR